MFWWWLVGALGVGVGTLLFGLRFEGLENIPEKGGYIVISNHRSYWDPIWIGAKVLPNKMCFMAKKELFKNKIFARAIKYFGAFPIDRGAGDMGAVEYAMKSVAEGRVLVIFPEGTRSSKSELLQFKSGAAHIIATTGVDVLPVAIDFKGDLHLWKRVTVRFGKVMSTEELGLSEYSLKAVKQASRTMRSTIDGMLEAAKCE